MPPSNDPILIDSEEHILHPFGANELKRFSSLSKDIFQVFNQEKTTLFLPHKYLIDIVHAEVLLQTGLLNQYNGMSQLYFITEKSTNKTIGMIELISPKGAQMHYNLTQYPYFIEFCLSDDHTGKGIMSILLPKLIDKLKQRGIKKIGAVAHPKNHSAIRVLHKAGLFKRTSFDIVQDVYHN